ncbi:MAG: CBS domain-containing protein [Deltaproteobacteria bacterium]|nr:CBS domain-containing protein [Deltaproteobacteria bacterium]
MTVDEIMTKDPVVASETTTLGEALEILSELEIRHLPVVRDGDLVGMLSDRDLRILGLSLINDLESMSSLRSHLNARVSSLMTGDVITVDRDASIREVVELMISEKVGAIPVVETDTATLVGIVSYIDILQAFGDRLD